MTVNLIFDRVSVRDFTDEPVKMEDQDLMLRAAMAAPSAMNQQCWEFCVIDDAKMLEELSHAAPYASPIGRAPLAIAVLGNTGLMKTPMMWQQDLAAATQNILLAATSRGIGTVWIGIAPHQDRMDAVSKALNLPDSVKPFCLIAVGHPRTRPEHKDGRYKPERVHRNGYRSRCGDDAIGIRPIPSRNKPRPEGRRLWRWPGGRFRRIFFRHAPFLSRTA